MTDPISAVGLAVSVETLASLAATIFCDLFKYYEAVRDAPKQSQELRQEIGALSEQLGSLSSVLASTPANSQLTIPISLPEVILEFQTMLNDMNDRVKVSRTKGLRRLKWPFSKDENERLLARIERYKTILCTSLNVQTAYKPIERLNTD